MNPRDQPPLQYSNPRRNTRDQADFNHYINELLQFIFVILYNYSNFFNGLKVQGHSFKL